MYRKIWCILIFGWLMAIPNVMAKAVVLPHETYYGRRGKGANAVYNALPNIPYNEESGWIKTDAYAHRMYQGTPACSRPELTSYAIFSGENGNATKTVFHHIPTIEYSLLYIYHAAEVFFGPSGHAAFYVSITVLDDTDTVGCAYKVGYRTLADTIGTHYHHLYIDPLTGGRAGYIDWQVKAFDLSRYIGRPLTIIAEATCCSNLSCKSQLSLAFEKASQIIGRCDDSIWVPTYINHPVWHRGEADGPVITTEKYFVVPDTIGYYTCELDNDCADQIQFLSVPFCPCRDSAQFVLVDTVVPFVNLPVEWHGHTFTADSVYYVDTLQNKNGCDSIIKAYYMDFSYSLAIYADGCDKPNVWHDLMPGDTVVVQAEPMDREHCFTHWSDGSVVNPRVYIMGSYDRSDTAYFAQMPTYTVTVYSEDCTDPNVFMGLHAGETVTIVPQAKPGDDLLRWSDGNTDNPRTVTITSDTTLTALWFIRCPYSMVTHDLDTTVCDTLMPYTWHGHTFTSTDEVYRDTMFSQLGCDSVEYVYQLSTIHCVPPCVPNLVYRKWQDFLFCDNSRLNQIAYQWYKDGEMLVGENSQYLYVTENLSTSNYYVVVMRPNGTTFETCPYTFDEFPSSASSYARVSAINGRKGWIRIFVPDNEAYVSIWNVMGGLVCERTIMREAEICLPAVGTYVISILSADRESVHKIINF